MLADKFNASESAIKSFLEADAGVSGLVNHFHEKLIDDIYRYTGAQLPAVAVAAIGHEDAGLFKSRIQTVIEVVTAGGDLSAVDGQCKQAMSLIINLLKKEDPRRQGRGISGTFDEIDVQGSTIVPPDKSNHGFIVSGMINVNVTINE